MSGGSMNYVYIHLEEAAGYAEDDEIKEILKDLSDVMRAQEWWWSADYTDEQYREKVAKFKSKWFHTSREERLTGYIDKRIGKLRADLTLLIGVREAE